MFVVRGGETACGGGEEFVHESAQLDDSLVRARGLVDWVGVRHVDELPHRLVVRLNGCKGKDARRQSQIFQHVCRAAEPQDFLSLVVLSSTTRLMDCLASRSSSKTLKVLL